MPATAIGAPATRGSRHRAGDSPCSTPSILPRECPNRVVLTTSPASGACSCWWRSPGGTLRWSGLRRIVEGVSEKMLAQTLQTLERDGFVLREADR